MSMKEFELRPVEAKQCRGCALRKPDTVIGDLTITGHDNAYCDAYTPPTGGKPAAILNDSIACDYRVDGDSSPANVIDR